MSLYGNDISYKNGAIKNAELFPVIYKNWKLRIYCDYENHTTQKLKKLGVDVVIMGESINTQGTLWRFLPIEDKSFDYIIIRDLDSYLNPREKAAVDEWIESGKSFHIMRDHPQHNAKIMAGMWGSKGNTIPNIRKMIDCYKCTEKSSDQKFLEKYVWPIAEKDSLIHGHYGGQPFPNHPHWPGFVGMRGAILEQDISHILKIRAETR